MRYYGNKTKLLPFIEQSISREIVPNESTFVDLFAGTCSVGKYFKQKGFRVVSNDVMEYSHAIAKAYIELNEVPSFSKLKAHYQFASISSILDYLNTAKCNNIGFMGNNYAPNGGRQYFSQENADRIDNIRTIIENWKNEQLISELEFYYLLTSLLEAVNLVSNVSGTYAAYLKTWDKRALKPLELKPIQIIHGVEGCKAYKEDANQLVKVLQADVLYLDPPYNTRQYTSNYFILELIAQGWFDFVPIPQGVAGLCVNDKQKSDYAITAKAYNALSDLINNVGNVKYIHLSYNNEGIIPIDTIISLLRTTGDVITLSQLHKRYRSINQTETSPNKTVEYLFKVQL